MELQHPVGKQRLRLPRLGQHALEALRHPINQRWAAAYAAGLLIAGSFTALEYTDTVPNVPRVQEPICLPNNTSSMRTSDATLEVSLIPNCFYPRMGLVRTIYVYQVKQGHTDHSHPVASSIIPKEITDAEITDVGSPRPAFLDLYLSPDGSITKIDKQNYPAPFVGSPGP